MSTEALNALRSLLGLHGFIDDPQQMVAYTTSMRNRHIVSSPLVALPNSVEQVSAVVKICRDYSLPIVPQGGNTGLVDGGIPTPGVEEIVVSLSRLNKIRDLDSLGAMVTVDAGVVLKTLQDAAAAAGFLFPLSMGSEGSMQVGGAISTNAGGTAVLRYGNTRSLVLGLEAVLPDGQIFSSLKKLMKDNTGYNLSQFFIGAEGTLGIVTAATLRLFPMPRQTLTAVVALSEVPAVIDLFTGFRAEAAEYLSAFELMSRTALALVTKHIPNSRFPGRDDAPWYVLIELSAASMAAPLQQLFENVVAPALEKDIVRDAVIAESAAQAKQFWHLREHIPDALRAEGNNRIHFDVSLPQSRIVDFMLAAGRAIDAMAPDTVLMPFGHIGDGNLHYNMYLPSARDAVSFAALKKSIQELVFGEVERHGGSISAEHGVGVERKPQIAKLKAGTELDLMKRIKRALDPEGIMNPGKIFD